MLSRKSRLASCTSDSLEAPLASQEHLRRASMMAARSTLLGQRVVQVSQEAQYQMERPASTRSYWPSCKRRTIRFGGCSMNVRIGQPAEHLPHWKQRRTELPDNASTFFTNPRFMVSRESSIFAFLIPPRDWAFTVNSPCFAVISDSWHQQSPFCKTQA